MATPTKLVLSLHNGKTAQPLQQGQPNLVKAQAGEHYRVLRDLDGKQQPAGDVIAKKSGKDLQLDYADGTRVVLQDYYVQCKGAAACDATLPASDGGSHVVTDNSAGVALGDGSTLVYAYGGHDALMGMAHGDAALGTALGGAGGSTGSDISYLGAPDTGSSQVGASGAAGKTGSGAGNSASNSDTGSSLSSMALYGLGLAAGAGIVAAAAGGGNEDTSISKDSGRGSDGSAPGAHHIVSGTVNAGAVVAGNDLSVKLFKADGITELGTAKADATGKFSIDVAEYTGVVIARVNNGSAADHIAPATGAATNLSANLMAVGMATTDTLTLNINGLTTVAALRAGAVFDGVSATSLTERTVLDANGGVAAAFGLGDLTSGEVTGTVTATGAANTGFTVADLSAAEKYGAMLAALSGVDLANGGNMQTTIDNLFAGLAGTGVDATLTAVAADALIAGSVRAVPPSGIASLPDIVSDLLAEGSAVTINDIAGNNVIDAGETGVTISGTNPAGAAVAVSIAGKEVKATVTGTTWSYTLSAADLAAIGQGGETFAATATVGETVTSARRTVLVDTIKPNPIISAEIPESGSGPITVTFTFSEAVTGFDASDIVLNAGVAKGAFTALSSNKFTLVVTPPAGKAADLTVNLAEGAASDLVGNASNAARFEATSHSAVSLASIAAGKGGFVVKGESAFDLAGYSVAAAGDVNGDGLADLIIGAKDNDALGDRAGRSYVVFGKTNVTPVNLADIAAGKGGFVINGSTAMEQAGISVSSAGDLNGDGLADLLVGGPRTNNAASRVYVVFGKADTAAVNLSTATATFPATAGFGIAGQSTSWTGYTVSNLGDVNGDGLSDLIFGLPSWDSPAANAGRVFIVHGATKSPGTLGSNLTNAFSYLGESAADALGTDSVAAAGDFNGDGLADMIVGASAADPNGQDSGRAYVIFGRTTQIAPGGSNNTTNASDLVGGLGGFAISGVTTGDKFGISAVGVGDVNGDGLADLLIGAPGTDIGASVDTGRSYVVFGKTGGGASIALSDIAAGRGGFVINGQNAGDASGFKVAAAGDLNGDGLADMLISANKADTAGGPDAGRTYVVFGTAATAPVNLATIADGNGGFVIDGVADADNSGAAVAAAGDVNGDGFGDLLVSSANNGSGAGATYVIFGGTSGVFSSSTADQVADSGQVMLTGTSASETLVGNALANTLVANGGADVLYGGAGNDTMVINAGNVAALMGTYGSAGNATQLSRIDGGAGIDSIVLDGAGIMFDLGAIRNAGQVGGINMSRISSIERIDLTGSGNNTLALTMADVVDMGGMNSFNSTWVDSRSTTVLGATEARHQLVIDGDAGDAVKIAGSWTLKGSVVHDGTSYDVYTSGTYAEVLIDSAITNRTFG